MNKTASNIYHKCKDLIYRYWMKNIISTIKNEDFLPIVNEELEHSDKISFFLPRLKMFSGGYTSILRLGTYLANQGYKVEYVVYGKQSLKELNAIAKSNLSSFKGKIVKYENYSIDKNSFLVATTWDSVYKIKLLPGYKLYFVQDYEPYFFEFGEIFLLSKETYRLGLHMVSLGEWNKKMILKEYPRAKVDTITFPFESTEYHYRKRDFSSYSEKSIINVAVYVKLQGKRLPYLIQNIMRTVVDKFSVLGITVNVLYYGEDKHAKFSPGKNLGKLSKAELEKLYHYCDFGVVASMTNISLIPYEMMATGLPVVEFEEGSFLDFFSRESAILTNYSGVVLFDKLVECIHNPEILEKADINAQREIAGKTWEKSGFEFAEILKSI